MAQVGSPGPIGPVSAAATPHRALRATRPRTASIRIPNPPWPGLCHPRAPYRMVRALETAASIPPSGTRTLRPQGAAGALAVRGPLGPAMCLKSAASAVMRYAEGVNLMGATGFDVG